MRGVLSASRLSDDLFLGRVWVLEVVGTREFDPSSCPGWATVHAREGECGLCGGFCLLASYPTTCSLVECGFWRWLGQAWVLDFVLLSWFLLEWRRLEIIWSVPDGLVTTVENRLRTSFAARKTALVLVLSEGSFGSYFVERSPEEAASSFLRI
ncbi:hypothetical protein SUGI_0882700 [Cryptomeria japonica]|nr:hypothetical protein SUGI_0882700 [Cryptomeria japonica]